MLLPNAMGMFLSIFGRTVSAVELFARKQGNGLKLKDLGRFARASSFSLWNGNKQCIKVFGC
jgi:hypothetical protein